MSSFVDNRQHNRHMTFQSAFKFYGAKLNTRREEEGEKKIRKLSATIDELHHRPFSVPCLPTDAPVSRYRYRLNDTSTFAPVFMQPASD